MNRNRYRLVFNRLRGQIMAVAETAASHSPAPGQVVHRAETTAFALSGLLVRGRNGLPHLLVSGAVFMAVSLTALPGHAQIVADRSAPATQQATILNTASGIPQVNIQTPSAAGVSRNTYTQFDVQRQGAVLNNSRQDTQTQLAGWVQANPWLAAGTARVILNEVNSSNPSLLKGYIEVAGDRAQVVIANPAGISCDGCGFVNASRATLTTGTPVLNGGSLDSYRVQGGVISIDGAGMDASRADYTDLISRAVKVNAGIWANELKVTTGLNVVNADHTQTSQLPSASASGPAPSYAIDVAQLGGMYAGKIVLVGTEAGLGVRNAGQIGASVGNVIVTAQGQLVNSGSLSANGRLDLTSSDGLQNSGNISSKTDLSVVTQGDVQNSGSLIAQGNLSVTANGQTSRIDNTGTAVLAAGVQSDGSFAGTNTLLLSATQGVTAHGQVMSSGDQTHTANSLDFSGATLRSASLSFSARTGSLDLSSALVQADGRFDASAALGIVTDGIQARANQINLQSATLSNQAGAFIASDTLTLNTSGSANNIRGLLFAQNTLDVQSGEFINDQGSLQAGGGITIDTHGQKLSNANTSNSGGIISGGTFSLAAGVLDNSAGYMGAASDLTINSAALNNSQGSIATQTNLNIQSNALTNDEGAIQSGGNLTINTHGQLLSNTNNASHGGIVSGSALHIHAADIANGQGYIGALGSIDINAQSVDNRQGNVSSATSVALVANGLDNRSGSLVSAGDITLAIGSGSVNNSTGLIRSGAGLTLTAAQIDNTFTSGNNQGIEAADLQVTALQLDNSNGAVRTNNSSVFNLSNALFNVGGLISSVGAINVQDTQTVKTLALSNDNGLVLAGNRLGLDAASLNNGSGTLASLSDLTLNLASDYLHTGQLQANGNLAIQIGGKLTNQGALQAGSSLNIAAINLDNSVSGQISGTSTTLNIANQLDNRGLIDGSDTRINAITINNLGAGRIYGDHISIAATTLTNGLENGNAAVVAARSRLDLGANTINNQEGALLLSLGDLAIGGSLDSNRLATGRAETINNGGGTIQALGALSLTANQINNINTNFSAIATLSDTITTTTTYYTSIGTFTDDQVTSTGARGWNGGLYLDGDNTNNYNAYYGIIAVQQNGSTSYPALYSYIRQSYKALTAQVTSSAPGQILSGTNMVLDASQGLTNDKSQIIAGTVMTVSGSSINNIAAQISGTEYHYGTSYSWGYVGHDGKSSGHHCDCSMYGFTPSGYAANIQVTTTAPVSVVLDHQAPANTGTIVPNQVRMGTIGTAVATGNAAVTIAASPTTVTTSSGGIRFTQPNLNLPNNSLFSTHSTNSNFLIETDTRFTNHQQWLSSDYILSAFSLDPALTQKRLGDGFYEQQLVREQVAQLTGRRFLTGYSDDQTQYQALMSAGVTFAQSHNLVPGVALSPAQVAQLTSDIVWLETQSVTLADGSTQQVLVPHVYAVVKPGDLDGTGTLLSANTIQAQLSGNLTNSGTIAGRTLVSLTADNVQNLGGHIEADTLALSARTDINNIGGRLAATSALTLAAGQDINLTSTTASGSGQVDNGRFSRTQLDNIAGLYVTGSNGTLTAVAGRDITLAAADINNQGTTTVFQAGRDLTLATVTTSDRADITQDAQNYARFGQSTDNGTHITTNGDLALIADRNLSTRAASVQTQGDLALQAGSQITLESGRSIIDNDVMSHTQSSGGGLFGGSSSMTRRDTANVDAGVASSFTAANISVSSGSDTTLKGATLTANQALAMTAGGNLQILADQNRLATTSFEENRSSGFLSSSRATDRASANSQQAQGATLSADQVSLSANQDVRISGSNAVATNDLTISAGKSLSIESAQNIYTNTESHEQSQSGLFSGGGFGITLGSRSQKGTLDGTQTTQTGSTVGSVQGNVTLVAGDAYKQTGSDVLAPQGDITIQGKTVDIVAAIETNQARQTFEAKQSGLTLSLSSPLITAVQIGQQMSQAASQTSDGRMQALAAAAAGLNLYNNAKDIQDSAQALINGKPEDAVSISLSLGSSKSQSISTSQSSTAKSSTITAGNDLTIQATGGGSTPGDLNVIGSQLQAGNNALLAAANNINLLAAANTSSSQSNSSGSSASIGVGFSLGANSGVSITASASQNKGNSNGSDVVYTNTTVNVGNGAVLVSGLDTTLHGAQVNARQIVADVGGNLNIASLQDTSTYQSKTSNSGFSITVPIVGTSWGGSVSAGQSKINSDYISVNQQSGLQAGDNGFQVRVGGNTDLKGAVIASTDKAVQDNKNNFQTGGSLTLTDLQNNASYQGNAVGVNIGAGVSTNGKLAPQGTSAGIGQAEGNASSTTQSGISGIAGNTNVRTGDSANGIQKIFDADKVQKDINAQVAITQQFNLVAPKAAATYANNQETDLKRQAALELDPDKKAALLAEASKWATNGSYSIAMNLIIGAAGGTLPSTAVKESLSWAANEMRQAMIADSSRFPGICASEKDCISNTSGKSVGVNGDNTKIAGGRIVLAIWCAAGGEYSCQKDPTTPSGYAQNQDGTVIFKPTDANGNRLTIDEFIKQHQELRSPLGGIQGGNGQMSLLGITFDYAPGSFWDKLAEAYAGTHDSLNSFIWYDNLGNGKYLGNTVQGKVGDVLNITNVATATPFAMSTILPPEVWNAIFLSIKH